MKKRILLNVLSGALTVILITVLLKYYVSPEKWKALGQLSGLNLLVACFFALLTYAGSGIEYFLLRKRFQFPMEIKDILLLPLAMNLWGSILPFQGSMIYSAYFLKRKYQIQVSHAMSISLFLYLVTVFLSGVFGLLLSLTGKLQSVWPALFSVLFLISPLLLWICFKIFSTIPELPWKPVNKTVQFLLSMLGQAASVWHDLPLVISLVGVYLLRMAAFMLLYVWISYVLGYRDISWAALFLLNLWNQLALLIRFTPNNMGITQLISAILFAWIGLKPEDGIWISLIATMIFLLLALTAGTTSCLYTEIILYRRKNSES